MSRYKYDYFSGERSKQYSFAPIFYEFYESDYYQDLSNDAIILYTFLSSRMALSFKNNWIDNDGRAYVYFTIEEATKFTKLGKTKTNEVFRELIDWNLIEKKQQGFGKPAKIYVKDIFNRVNDTEIPNVSNEEDTVNAQQFRIRTASNSDVRTARNSESELLDNQACGQKYIDIVNRVNNISINQSSTNLKDSREQIDQIDEPVKYEEVIDEIKENISYEELVEEHNTPTDVRFIDEFVNVMSEVQLSNSKKIVIAKTEYPIDYVKKRFKQIKKDHIEYIFDSLVKNTNEKISNPKAYLLAVLFNSVSTLELSNANEANLFLNRSMPKRL